MTDLMRANTSKYNRFESFKVLCHSERLKQLAEGNLCGPVEWVIYPSNVCGYKCGHCIMKREQADHRNTLPEATMWKIPEDVARMGIKTVIFSGGGDPLANKWTSRIAREIKASGVQVGLNNQGFLLEDPTPFSFIRFSVDAATRETYKTIHGVDGWERVSENIGELANLRARGANIEMGMAFLITPTNWHEVLDFCDWANQYNPDFVHIRPAYLDADYLQSTYPGGGLDLKERIIPMLKKSAEAIKERYSNVFFRVDKFDGFWTPKLYTKCRSTPLMAVTSGDGAFLVCQDRGISKSEEYLRFGNYNTQTFEEIWWGDEHKQVIERIDLERCPRCVEAGYNEIIEHCFVNDGLKRDLL